MIPSRRLLHHALHWLLLAPVPLAVRVWADDWYGLVLALWLGLGGLLLVVAGMDAWRARRVPAPAASRQLPAALSVQARHDIRLRFNSEELPAQFIVADDHPGDDAGTGLPLEASRADEAITEITYRYRPGQRGRAAFGRIHVWVPSPLGLWSLHRRINAHASVPVYPDFSMLEHGGLDPAHPLRQEMGQRLRRRRGDGMEFHQLREYQPGDSLRQIDWKATARRQRLISREYQDEQNQQLIVLLDGGERLALPVAGLTGFDHGLNAGLLLAWSALNQGDRPGTMVFSGEAPRWVPPVRGRRGLNRLLNALYDLHPSSQASDFTSAARDLMRRCHRRALVVLITRLQPDDSDDLKAALALLRRRHLVMIGDMLLPAQAELPHRPVRDFDDALLVSGDARFEQERRALHTHLRHAGALVVEATPSRLPGTLNATYLSLKRSGRL
jgi:uncharacterized protein (DUF58 family)